MLTDAFEIEIGTDPLVPDTDGDGYSDLVDIYPLDPGRHEEPSLPGFVVASALGAALLASFAARRD